MPLNLGELVHVPSTKAGLDSAFPWAMTCGAIQSISNGKISINLPNGEISKPIYQGLARKKLGIFIVQIGDYVTEGSLLVPLRKSILQYTRLLLSDDYIRCVSVRSLSEFEYYWRREHLLMSHIILIGHGKPRRYSEWVTLPKGVTDPSYFLSAAPRLSTEGCVLPG